MVFEGEVVKKGEVKQEDIEDIKEDLTGPERLRLISSVPVKDGQGRVLTVLTNQRLILMRRGNFKFFGEKKGFKDFPFDSIEQIDVEERKKYDFLKILLKDGSEEQHMIPKNSGEKITSMLANLKTQKKREEERGETPLKKLEKLSNLKEEGTISEEEFNQKKEEILEGI